MAAQSITYPAFSKINLFLHITGQRKDDYHTLQTWFQFIDLKDFLTFSPRNDQHIHLISDVKIGALPDNLIYRAAQAIKPYAHGKNGFDITLQKNIPMGAGLGGGSSNAATTLIALNQLWRCGLSEPELKAIGVKLGADVPIFLHQKAAWAEGIGEVLTTKYYIEQYALIIKPNFHASTAELFNHPNLNKSKSLLDKNRVHCPVKHDNVFAPVIIQLYNEQCDFKKEIGNTNQIRLTGTGACFYLLSTDLNHLLSIQQKLRKSQKEVDSWIVKTVNFAPVEGDQIT